MDGIETKDGNTAIRFRRSDVFKVNSSGVRALKRAERAELRIFGTTVLMRLRLADLIFGESSKKRRRATGHEREWILRLMEKIEKRLQLQTPDVHAIRCLDAAIRLAELRIRECYERHTFIGCCRSWGYGIKRGSRR